MYVLIFSAIKHGENTVHFYLEEGAGGVVVEQEVAFIFFFPTQFFSLITSLTE